MAKKIFGRVLPLLLAFCIFMSTTAFAATTYSIEVTLSGPDENGITQTVTGKSSKYGSLNSMLAYEVVQIINSKLNTIRDVYVRTGLSQIVYSGLEAFSEGEEAWEAYSDIYYDAVTGDFKDTLRDLDSTFADLTPNEVNEISYLTESGKEYVVTVTLNKHVTNGGYPAEKEDKEDKEDQPEDGTASGTGDGCSVNDENCAAGYYGDIDLNAWYHDGVCYCLTHSIMNGYPNKDFLPHATLTRAHVAQVLYNMHKLEQIYAGGAKKVFDDVETSEWYAEAISWASDAGVILGYGNGNFGPNDPVTREQLAAMIYRYCQYKGYDVSAGEKVDFLLFTDAKTVSDWALSAIKWAYGAEIVNGLGDGRLDPVGLSTRAQAATMFMRYFSNFVAK